MEYAFEYELVDISIGYDVPEDDVSWRVSEAEREVTDKPDIEYDADGVPMGNTREEIEKRREIIHDYIQQWRTAHKDNPRVFNENLNEYIRINQVFLLESVHHAVGNYKSTKAVLQMDDIMAKAEYIGDSLTKDGDSNQKSFEKMIVMIYRSEKLGNVKMTVGLKRRTHEKVEYSITVPPTHTPFIEPDLKIGVNKKKRKKHHK